MANTFRKAVLNLGTYESQSGKIVVTPSRLAHWERSIKQLQSSGYTIPMHWDHADDEDIELLEPIKMSTLAKGESRSAQNTVGRLVTFEVAPDGRSAELTVETLTKSATERVETNAVFVSPVLFDSWADGRGNQYSDIVGSVDLVDYPVDFSQSPFVPVTSVSHRMSCVIRKLSTSSTIYKLSEKMPMDESAKQDNDGDEGSKPASNPIIPEPQAPTNPSSTSVADVITALAAMKIILPDDTTPANFLDRLRPALMTAAAQNGDAATSGDQLPPDPTPKEPETEQEKPVLGDNPQIAAMSLRLRNFEKAEIEKARNSLASRLRTLLETGRATPAEHTAKTKVLGISKLSLGAGDVVAKTDLDIWIESREATPEGSCWEPKVRIEKMGLKTANPPAAWNSKDKSTELEEQKAQKRQMLRIHRNNTRPI